MFPWLFLCSNSWYSQINTRGAAIMLDRWETFYDLKWFILPLHLCVCNTHRHIHTHTHIHIHRHTAGFLNPWAIYIWGRIVLHVVFGLLFCFLVERGCPPGHCKIHRFGSIAGFHPLGAKSFSPALLMTIKNVRRHCQISPVENP